MGRLWLEGKAESDFAMVPSLPQPYCPPYPSSFFLLSYRTVESLFTGYLGQGIEIRDDIPLVNLKHSFDFAINIHFISSS